MPAKLTVSVLRLCEEAERAFAARSDAMYLRYFPGGSERLAAAREAANCVAEDLLRELLATTE